MFKKWSEINILHEVDLSKIILPSNTSNYNSIHKF